MPIGICQFQYYQISFKIFWVLIYWTVVAAVSNKKIGHNFKVGDSLLFSLANCKFSLIWLNCNGGKPWVDSSISLEFSCIGLWWNRSIPSYVECAIHNCNKGNTRHKYTSKIESKCWLCCQIFYIFSLVPKFLYKWWRNKMKQNIKKLFQLC